ncbi:uncharacterized protein DDB_G0271670-like [Jatropha curcas]|uniref:uncharacterized protein DDB_G0271670-like n=1 Tax=Jatropha curcas TaxID=180498 RepID=UPI001895E76B|nr:uncharacterized protein DDB_G0271670-like [Jatropha curcas]
MGKKKDKGKKPLNEPDSPTKALSEHSENLSKALTSKPDPAKNLQQWIEELSKSPEIVKALQNIASSSTENPGMISQPKAIVSAHDTATPSQTVGDKELSNPLKGVALPKSQLSFTSKNPDFGIQKAKCQARLAAAKTPEEYKLICEEMFQLLSTSSDPQVKPSSSKIQAASSSQSSTKTAHKGKGKISSSSSSDTSSSSSEDSDIL